MRLFSLSVLLIIFTSLPACTNTVSRTVVLAPDSQLISWSGRWNRTDTAVYSSTWQGSSATLGFRGRSISAELDVGAETQAVRVIVDGVPIEPAMSVAPGRQSVVLAAGLDPEVPHTVTVMKESSALSTLRLYGFAVPYATMLNPLSKPAGKIAFFGDSNMEGYSLYSEKNDDSLGTYYAYPATVSRMLNAEMELQAVGGAKLADNDGNDVLSFIYTREYGTKNTNYRSGFEPDVIVVNAGANDVSELSAAEQKKIIKSRYRLVIENLRNVYGNEPHIILYNAYSWDQREPAGYSYEVANEYDENVSTLIFPWCWEQWHGDMIDHAGQARILAGYIESLNIGFTIQQDAEVVSGYGNGMDVANGSFEGTARDGYGAFGWRYFTDGVELVDDVAGAKDGAKFIRLEESEAVHQCVDATGDFRPGAAKIGQEYQLSAALRSAGGSVVASLGADFEGQNMYKRRDLQSQEIAVNETWQRYSVNLTAPADTWKVFVILQSVIGTLEIDDVQLVKIE